MAAVLTPYNPSFYNAVPPFCDAVKNLNESQAMTYLDELGKIFAKHKAYDKFGIVVIHRHFDMEAHEILVETTKEDNSISVALPWILNGDKAMPFDMDLWKKFDLKLGKILVPQTWKFSDDGKVVPFEFLATENKEETHTPSSDFVEELYKKLVEFRLENILGLRLVNACGYEITHKGTRASITHMDNPPEGYENDDSMTPVFWTFDCNGEYRRGLTCQGHSTKCTRCGFCFWCA